MIPGKKDGILWALVADIALFFPSPALALRGKPAFKGGPSHGGRPSRLAPFRREVQFHGARPAGVVGFR